MITPNCDLQRACPPKTVPIQEEFLPNSHRAKTASTHKEELSAWIRNFVYSFRPGKFRDILESASFLRQPGGVWQDKSLRVFSGLAVVISCESWNDHMYLVAKTKQPSYRIRKLDPKVELLMLLSPNGKIVGVTVLATGERFAIANQKRRCVMQPPLKEY